MENDYSLNPAISILCEQIERASLEREVQAVWESLLWTVFPASDHWMTVTKYKQGATEPDNKVMKLIHYNTGWAPIDVLTVELKRPREKVTLDAFNTVARDLLDDHMSESSNPDGTTLFGAVGIGKHVVFYQKVLPHGNLETRQAQPFHLLTDAPKVQECFDYYKLHVPQSSYQAPGSSYEAPTSSYYQAPASSHPAQASSYQAPGSSYEASTSSYYQAPGSSYEASTSSYYQAPASSHPAQASSYQAPGSSYEASTSSYYQAPASASTSGYYQAPAPSPLAQEPSYEAPTSSYPAPASDYPEGDNEYTKGDLETQQADTMRADQYTTVKVTRERHMTRPDEFFFRDRSGKERVTTRDEWHRTRASSGHHCWIYRGKYVCYEDIFRK